MGSTRRITGGSNNAVYMDGNNNEVAADVKFTLKVNGVEYPSLATAVGAAKAAGA